MTPTPSPLWERIDHYALMRGMGTISSIEEARKAVQERIDWMLAEAKANAHGVDSSPSAETDAQRQEAVAAWNDLPEALRCHPALKRLYRALGGPLRDASGGEGRKC